MAGGAMRLGIAPFRIPHNVVDKEIQYISDMGVYIRTDTTIGKDIDFEELRKDYHAIFIAVGAYSGGHLHVYDCAIEGVINGATFMTRVNTGKVDVHEREVVVIVGGYTAVDAARTCIRLGVKKVSLVFARTRKDMTNPEEELKATEEEGVNFYLLAMPTKIINDSNNKVKGLECIKVEMKGKDELGRKVATPLTLPFGLSLTTSLTVIFSLAIKIGFDIIFSIVIKTYHFLSLNLPNTNIIIEKYKEELSVSVVF